MRLCCLSFRCPLIVALCQLVVALPLVLLSLHHPLVVLLCQLVVALPLAIFSLRCCLVLFKPAGCHIASPRPLVAPPTHPLILSSWTRCPLVISLSRHATSRCLIASVGCCIIISHRPLAAPSSCPLIVLAGCCIASPCAALLSSCRSPSPTPWNAVECCCHHRTPPPPSSLKAISIVHCCHSCRPLPPPNKNAHLCPSSLSNADACHRHPPLLMSIFIIASLSPFHSPHRRHRRTLLPQLNAIFIVHHH